MIALIAIILGAFIASLALTPFAKRLAVWLGCGGPPGRHPFQADRRHLHHRLLDLGFNQRKVVLTLYAVSAFLSAMAMFMGNASRIGAFLALVAVGMGGVVAVRRLGLDEFHLEDIRSQATELQSRRAGQGSRGAGEQGSKGSRGAEEQQRGTWNVQPACMHSVVWLPKREARGASASPPAGGYVRLVPVHCRTGESKLLAALPYFLYPE